jgi:RNA polymerase sigma-70 factor (ECF subfamily)
MEHTDGCKLRGGKVSDGNVGERPLDAAGVFDEHRGLLVSVAYRVLGSVSDAEDAVQDAWLRWSGVDHSKIANTRAFLVRVTTRLAIDRLRRAKARRESYVGPWLPEPVLTAPDVAEDVALAESISMAMLVVLETLSPLERAVFVLREAFSMPYTEIAEILGRKEEAVRQLARRAREHVQERRSRFEADQTAQRRVTERFLEATSSGDLETLMRVLAPGVALMADGGGRALAPRRPVRGAEKVARFLLSVATEERTARFLRSVGAEPSLRADRSRRSFLMWPTAWCEPYTWWPTPRSWPACEESGRRDARTAKRHAKQWLISCAATIGLGKGFWPALECHRCGTDRRVPLRPLCPEPPRALHARRGGRVVAGDCVPLVVSTQGGAVQLRLDRQSRPPQPATPDTGS